MPLVRLNTFNGDGLAFFFLWDNTPADDQILFDWVAVNGASITNMVIDRSGDNPVLRGDILGNVNLGGEYQWGYGPTGEIHEVQLSATEEQWIWSNVPTGERPDLLPGLADITGRFRCNAYGLPYNLNDLIATPQEETE
jgi:hypothetical protein